MNTYIEVKEGYRKKKPDSQTAQANTQSQQYQAAATASVQGQISQDNEQSAKEKADADAKAAADALAKKNAEDEAKNEQEMASISSYATKMLDNGFQKTFANFLSSVQAKEVSDAAALKTQPIITPLPATIDASVYNTQTDINATLNEVEKHYIGKFGFTKFRNSATQSYLGKCVAPDESLTNSYNMKLLDNNYHTLHSCRMNAAAQNYSKFALVKPDPATTKIDDDLYQCYVSNDPLPENESFDYVVVWSQTASSVSVDATTGDFMVGSTNLSNLTNKFHPSYCGTSTPCTYFLTLQDNGNLELHRVLSTQNGPHDKIVWQLFSDYSVVDKISKIAPITNNAWKSTNNTTLAQGKSMPTDIPFLTSPSGFFKLAFNQNNNNIVLKACVFGCKSNDVSYKKGMSDANVKLYTNVNTDSTKGQSYYIYQLNSNGPKVNTTYYEIDSGDYKSIQPIDSANPDLQKGMNYTKYDGFYPSTDSTISTTTTDTVEDCKNACSQNDNCTGVFAQANARNKTVCTLSSNAAPYFMPNQSNPSINDSTYYIREPKMNLANNQYNIPKNVVVNTTMDKYSSFNMGNTISTSGYEYGMPSVPSWAALKQREYELRMGTTQTPNTFTTAASKEGFDTHGYQDASAACSSVGSGCQPAIQNGQITPLIQIANDYDNQIKQMSRTYIDMSNNLDSYYATRKVLNNNAMYDFSANRIFTKEDNSLVNAMQQDTKQMALQQNNLYISGTILTTTLLITAIYLGMD